MTRPILPNTVPPPNRCCVNACKHEAEPGRQSCAFHLEKAKADKRRRKERERNGETIKLGRPERAGKSCTQCEGQSWRRPRVGLCRCGESFRDEPPVDIVAIVERRKFVG